MEPEPPLIIRGASTMRRIDKLFNYISPNTHQIRVDVNAALNEAFEIDAQMQAGVKGPQAFQVYNPELVRLKMEAGRGVNRALIRMDTPIISMCLKIDRTRRKIVELEEKMKAFKSEIALGAQGVAVPVDAGAIQHEQVVYSVRGSLLSLLPDSAVPGD